MIEDKFRHNAKLPSFAYFILFASSNKIVHTKRLRQQEDFERVGIKSLLFSNRVTLEKTAGSVFIPKSINIHKVHLSQRLIGILLLPNKNQSNNKKELKSSK